MKNFTLNSCDSQHRYVHMNFKGKNSHLNFIWKFSVKNLLKIFACVHLNRNNISVFLCVTHNCNLCDRIWWYPRCCPWLRTRGRCPTSRWPSPVGGERSVILNGKHRHLNTRNPCPRKDHSNPRKGQSTPCLDQLPWFPCQQYPWTMLKMSSVTMVTWTLPDRNRSLGDWRPLLSSCLDVWRGRRG